MHYKTIGEISKRMAGIDIAVLSTHTEGGQIANRPMSNNGDVEYDGTSYYFTYEQARTVADIQANPKVALGFTGEGGIFSDAIYVAIEGSAELIRDKAAFKAHWTGDLDRWFDKGVDTPDIVLIKVKANRITYWDGEEEGEVQVWGLGRRQRRCALTTSEEDLGEVSLRTDEGHVRRYAGACPKPTLPLHFFRATRCRRRCLPLKSGQG